MSLRMFIKTFRIKTQRYYVYYDTDNPGKVRSVCRIIYLQSYIVQFIVYKNITQLSLLKHYITALKLLKTYKLQREKSCLLQVKSELQTLLLHLKYYSTYFVPRDENGVLPAQDRVLKPRRSRYLMKNDLGLCKVLSAYVQTV